MAPQTTPEPFVRDRIWAFDFALCAAIGVVADYPGFGGYGTSLALTLSLVLPLMIRRKAPSLALGLASAAALAQVGIVSTPTVGIIAVPIIVYSATRWGREGLGGVALMLGLAGSVLGPARWVVSANGLSLGSLAAFGVTFLACAGVVTGAYLVGRNRRQVSQNQLERARSAVEREQLLVAEQEQRSRLAATDERNRIARDLHDIVAHSLSVIVVQAEGGRALAAKHPERAPEVLGTIADTSREALEEMRQMVGLLRSGSDSEDASFVPTPGLPDIPELVRKSSDRADLTSFGDPPQVSQALGLTAYRVVQESLTNVLKHAGPSASARVTTAYSAHSIELEITDDGRGAAAALGDGGGNGLRGMQERVALHHGTLWAGPSSGGGFAVRASLPLDAETAVPWKPAEHAR